MNELLTKGIDHTEFKDSELGRIPKSWSTKTLKNLSENGKPVLRTGPFGTSLKSKDFIDSGIPVINIQNLGEGQLINENMFFISKQKGIELSNYKVSEGDLVFSRVADVGRSVVIPEYASGWIISSNLMRISIDKNKLDPQFLMYQLVHGPHIQGQMRQVVLDAGRQVITGPVVSKLKFLLPPLTEQKNIVQKVDSLFKNILTKTTKVEHLGKLKKSLMQDLLKGKVRVSVN